MTQCERYIKTLLFGKPDKVPFQPGDPRESTLQAWHEQGLPGDMDWREYVHARIGVEPMLVESSPEMEENGVWLESRMIPQFKEKVLEEKETTMIVQDWKGNICEISKEYDATYLRYPKDFVTRKWIACPVSGRDDWEAMKERYKPDDSNRIPPDMAGLGKKLERRDFLIKFNISGPFWQMREWLGAEKTCMLFIEDPDFVREMVRFWGDFISCLLEKVLPYLSVDLIHISEDIAYKGKPFISPKMMRAFLQPCYRQWYDIIKAGNCPIYMMDSDGYIGDIIPVWIESGFNACDPVEVAAGCDINEFRKTFGEKMALRGGIDKRAIAIGGSVIANEMARIEPVIKSGGYIPGCDHGVPADVGLNQYLEYCEILACMTGWE